jgi:hypothetical protein
VISLVTLFSVKGLLDRHAAGPTTTDVPDRLSGDADGGRSTGIFSFLESLIIETIIDA